MIPHSKPWILDVDKDAVLTVLNDGMISQGKIVDKFQNAVAEYVGCSFAVAQSSGSASIVLALKTLDVGAGDSVVLPTYVCRSVYQAVLCVGAKPILCDVNSFGVIDADSIGPVIDNSTKAIIAVHIFGHPCSIPSLRQFQLPIIEDACQAFGQHIGNNIAGSLGDIGIFSFHATKCFTSGEGGMLVTNNPFYAAKANQLSQGSQISTEKSFSLMSDLQAALGLSQLKRYHTFMARRSSLFQIFDYNAKQCGLNVATPKSCTAPFRFTIRSSHSYQYLKDRCAKSGFSLRKGVDELLHRSLNLDDKDFPNAVRIFNTNLSIPFYPSLSDKEVDQLMESFLSLLPASL